MSSQITCRPCGLASLACECVYMWLGTQPCEPQKLKRPSRVHRSIVPHRAGQQENVGRVLAGVWRRSPLCETSPSSSPAPQFHQSVGRAIYWVGRTCDQGTLVSVMEKSLPGVWRRIPLCDRPTAAYCFNQKRGSTRPSPANSHMAHCCLPP